MKQKWGILSILIVALVAFLVGCSPSAAPASPSTTPSSGTTEEATVTYIAAASVSAPGQFWDRQADALIELLSEKSGGRFVADKLDAGMQGNSREVGEAVQMGTIEVLVVGDMELNLVTGNIGWAWIPFLTTTYEQADDVYYGGWINEKIKEKFASVGIVKIGNAENEFRLCGTVDKPIATISDFKGVKIRTPELPDVIRFYELCGALPVAISPPEVMTALQQGTCDGLDNSIINIKNMGVYDMVQHITRTNHLYAGASIVCNADFWNSLSSSDQQIFLDAAKENGDEYIQLYREEAAALLADPHLTVHEPDAEMKETMINIGLQILDDNAANYDADIVELIRKQMNTNIAAIK